ncbi:hypothetical protein OEZ85_004121 [Tetradesmus obliquus]|uniref:Serpin domain-containing protein n=1 Tax=Tetradesmus obliquus TaxID=3088 RepID=A0ABY8UDS2_TETOB|nr:hypothetical protein OEZ85_004121 [Tetradesmus obliquus]
MSLPIPEIGKRPRDDETEALIREALQEEELLKKQKKGEHAAAGAKPGARRQKGQTLAEWEAAEGGPVKESLVGMAAVKRALRRKQQRADDDETGLPDDIEAWEEGDEEEEQQEGAAAAAAAAAAARKSSKYGRMPAGISDAVAAIMEGDGGFATTGFNMRQEREEGNIDAEGNFIPAKDDDETAKDAWLNSDEAKGVSEKVKAAAAARAAAMAAADEAPALSETAVATAQRDIAALLQPGESVTAALRRLGQARRGAAPGKAMGKREKQRLAAQQAAGGEAAVAAAAAADAAAAKRDFAKLTELADLLLNAGGEMDVYSHRKEQLQRWADAVLPQTNVLAGVDDDDDMFASEEEQDAKKQPAAAATASQQQLSRQVGQQQQPQQQVAAASRAAPDSTAAASAASTTAAPAAAPAAAAVDYSSWPVKELRRFLSERGMDSSSIVEKQELVAMVAKAAESSAAVAPPPGYRFDPSSGFYHSSESGMYWDASSGGFYSEGKWYSYDEAAGQFVEWNIGQLQQLKQLTINDCHYLECLPASICQLSGLQRLTLRLCPALAQLPANLGALASLAHLSISLCYSLRQLPASLASLPALQRLHLASNYELLELPAGLGGDLASSSSSSSSSRVQPSGLAASLTSLHTSGSHYLQQLPVSLGQLLRLRSLSIGNCHALSGLPASLSDLSSLSRLQLSHCPNLVRLPEGFAGDLIALQDLALRQCEGLAELPEGLAGMAQLSRLVLEGCSRLQRLPAGLPEVPGLQLVVRNCPGITVAEEAGSLRCVSATRCRAVGAAFGPAGAFISPLSIYIALALALNGATPNTTTYSQLWTPLAQSITPAPFITLPQLNSYTRVLTRTLIREARAADGTEMMNSNVIFTNRTPVEAEYAAVALGSFNAPVLNATSATPINNWVKKKTNNLIAEAVPSTLKFMLLVVNSIYFFGSWIIPFNKTYTGPEPFTTPDGSKIQVNMMHSKFTGMFFEGLRLPQIRINNDTTTASGGYRAVKLTYRDSNFSAIALLCDEKKHKLDASACLNSLDIEDVLSGAGWRDISQFDSINLPRFEVEVKQLSVKKALQAMNVTEPFSGDAKFRKLSSMPLKIDDIYHSSVVKVDEEGTEAAAVTVFNLGPTAAPGEMLEFNRPFVFLVYDEEQATVMFMGVVNCPTESK